MKTSTNASPHTLNVLFRGALYGGIFGLSALVLDLSLSQGWLLRQLFHLQISWSTGSWLALSTLALDSLLLGALLGSVIGFIVHQWRRHLPRKSRKSPHSEIRPLPTTKDAQNFQPDQAGPNSVVKEPSSQGQPIGSSHQKDSASSDLQAEKETPLTPDGADLAEVPPLSDARPIQAEPEEEESWESKISDWAPVLIQAVKESSNPEESYNELRSFLESTNRHTRDTKVTLKAWLPIIEKYPLAARFLWQKDSISLKNFDDFKQLDEAQRSSFLTWFLEPYVYPEEIYILLNRNIFPKLLDSLSYSHVKLMRDRAFFDSHDFFERILRPWMMCGSHASEFFKHLDDDPDASSWDKYFDMDWDFEKFRGMGTEAQALAQGLILRLKPQKSAQFIFSLVHSLYREDRERMHHPTIDHSQSLTYQWWPTLSAQPEILSQIERCLPFFYPQTSKIFDRIPFGCVQSAPDPINSKKWTSFAFHCVEFGMNLDEFNLTLELEKFSELPDLFKALLLLDMHDYLDEQKKSYLRTLVCGLPEDQFWDLLSQKSERVDKIFSMCSYDFKFREQFSEKIKYPHAFSELWKRNAFYTLSKMNDRYTLDLSHFKSNLQEHDLFCPLLLSFQKPYPEASHDVMDKLFNFLRPAFSQDLIKNMAAFVLNTADLKDPSFFKKDNFFSFVVSRLAQDGDRPILEEIALNSLQSGSDLFRFLSNPRSLYFNDSSFLSWVQRHYHHLFCSENFSLDEQALIKFFDSMRFLSDRQDDIDQNTIKNLLKNISKEIFLSTQKGNALFFNLFFSDCLGVPQPERFASYSLLLEKAGKTEVFDFNGQDLDQPISTTGFSLLYFYNIFNENSKRACIENCSSQETLPKSLVPKSFLHHPFFLSPQFLSHDCMDTSMIQRNISTENLRTCLVFFLKHFEDLPYESRPDLQPLVFLRNEHLDQHQDLLVNVTDRCARFFIAAALKIFKEERSSQKRILNLLSSLFEKNHKIWDLKKYMFQIRFEFSSLDYKDALIFFCSYGMKDEDLQNMKKPLYSFETEKDEVNRFIEKFLIHLKFSGFYSTFLKTAFSINLKLRQTPSEKNGNTLNDPKSLKPSIEFQAQTPLQRWVAHPLFDRNVLPILASFAQPALETENSPGPQGP